MGVAAIGLGLWNHLNFDGRRTTRDNAAPLIQIGAIFFTGGAVAVDLAEATKRRGT